MSLNRATIVSTALQLLDTYGLPDVTMRRVATTLSVAPGALYWHVKNKQALVAAMAAEILSPLEGSGVEELALNLRSVLLAHRDGAEVVTAGLAQPGGSESRDDAGWEDLLDRFSAAARKVAPTAAPAEHRLAAQSILHAVIGATLLEQSRAQLAESTGCPAPNNGAADVRGGVRMLLRGLRTN